MPVISLLQYLLEFQTHIETHDDLNPILWKNEKLLPEIKTKCLEIVKTFTEQALEDDEELNILDVVLIGSNCNYNYNDTSDIDIHIIVDLNSDDYEYKYFQLLGRYWKADHDIELNGFPVELYVQSRDEKTTENAGTYSLKSDKWLHEPTKYDIPTHFNEGKIKEAVEQELSKIKELKKKECIDSLHAYVDELRDKRKKSLKKDGEYGFDNLVYKVLRANGVFKEISDFVNEITTKKLSLKT